MATHRPLDEGSGAETHSPTGGGLNFPLSLLGKIKKKYVKSTLCVQALALVKTLQDLNSRAGVGRGIFRGTEKKKRAGLCHDVKFLPWKIHGV